MKKVLFTQTSDFPHWVGNGFPVRTIFSYNEIVKEISPFLLLDYAGPSEFPANNSQAGVGSHPHRGFETVTISYQGQVEHRDSAGGGGVINPGDIQWMTAGSGLVHEEMHGKDFSKSGGLFEMVQLWVNLPKKDKMTKPRYQGLTKEQTPTVTLPNEAGTVRVIAGDYSDAKGPAKTFSPINLWDVRMKSGGVADLKVPAGHTALIFVLSGSVRISDSHTLKDAEMAILEKETDTIHLHATEDSKILFLGGEPINDPVVGYGPFVMNTQPEIMQAFKDFEAGKMGVLAPIEGSN